MVNFILAILVLLLKDNYLSYEEAQYEKIEGYGYLGVDTNQNLTLQSARIANVNGTQVKMSTGQVRVDNPLVRQRFPWVEQL